MHGLERETLNMKQEKGNLIYGFHTFISSVLEIVFSCHDPSPFNNTIETQVKVSMDVLFILCGRTNAMEVWAIRLHVRVSTLGFQPGL